MGELDGDHMYTWRDLLTLNRFRDKSFVHYQGLVQKFNNSTSKQIRWKAPDLWWVPNPKNSTPHLECQVFSQHHSHVQNAYTSPYLAETEKFPPNISLMTVHTHVQTHTSKPVKAEQKLQKICSPNTAHFLSTDWAKNCPKATWFSLAGGKKRYLWEQD